MAISTRAQQLEQLASALPVANPMIKQGMDEARKTQLQENIKQMTAAQPTNITAAAQGVASQSAQASAQSGIQSAQDTASQQSSMGQLALEQGGREVRATAANNELGFNAFQRAAVKRLEGIDRSAKQDLFDKQLNFKLDESGRSLMNERQLLDWAATKARNSEEFKNYTQTVEQAHSRKTAILEEAQRKITKALELGYQSDKMKLDQNQRKQLIQAKMDLEKKIRTSQAEAANRRMKGAAIGSMIGIGVAVAAAPFTGGASLAYVPAAAAAGGAAGTAGAERGWV